MKKLAILVPLALFLASCSVGPPVGLPHCRISETPHIRSLDFVGQYEYDGTCDPLAGGAGD